MPIFSNTSFLAIVLACIAPLCAAMAPEDVLGDYTRDPLFGVAAATQEVRVEILHQLLFPEEIFVRSGENVRFVIENRSRDVHVLLFSEQDVPLEFDEAFKSFVEDEIQHASAVIPSNDGHVHHHQDRPAKSIVGEMEDQPTVTLEAYGTREIVLKFNQASKLYLSCIVEGHEDHGHRSVIYVTDGSSSDVRQGKGIGH